MADAEEPQNADSDSDTETSSSSEEEERPRRIRKPLAWLKKLKLPLPDPRYVFEKTVSELQLKETSTHGLRLAEPTSAQDVFDHLSNRDQDVEGRRPRLPLYPVGWGWNSEGRAGSLTERQSFTPHHVQRSIRHNYVASAAGYSHSLLVSEQGQIFSFGGGRDGQLGYGNLFNDDHPKGGITQMVPRQVTPSGVYYQGGTDMKVAQVACGASFSIAREICPEEGVEMRRGLLQAEQALLSLGKMYKDCITLQKALATVRQERFAVGKVSRGAVTSWGTGERGQLGLGPEIDFSPAPSILLKLQNFQIREISAGLDHVLARSTTGQLFSWGSGRNGKLGHGDFEDRYSPEQVMFFRLFNVECCSAGDNHSAVLITNLRSSVPRSEQLRRMSCFGRGAHGRLGCGSNRNSHTPVVVSKWPPSIDGWQIRQVACGGAHTVALMEKAVSAGIANPWGVETAVACFGYGSNGQLGNGYTTDCYLPVKARMASRHVVGEVSAGRSWTMARTITGELFTWGKGLRGQLGQGDDRKFSVVPERVECFGAFVKIEGAGHAHNVCLVSRKKYLNEPLLTQLVKESRRVGSGSAISQDAGSFGFTNVFAPLVETTLDKTPSSSLYSFNCCRSTLGDERGFMRFACKECGINCICHTCAKLCHIGHTIISRDCLTSLEINSKPPTYIAAQVKKKKLQQRRPQSPEKDKNRPKDKERDKDKGKNILFIRVLRRFLTNPTPLPIGKGINKANDTAQGIKLLTKRELNKVIWRNNHNTFEKPELQPPFLAPPPKKVVRRSPPKIRPPPKHNPSRSATVDLNMTPSSESKDGRQGQSATTTRGQQDHPATSLTSDESDSNASVASTRKPPPPPMPVAMEESDTERHLDRIADDGDGIVQYFVGGGGQGGEQQTVTSKRPRRVSTCRCGLFNMRCRSLPAILEGFDEDSWDALWMVKQRHLAARIIQRTCRRHVEYRNAVIATRKLGFARRLAAKNYWFDVVLDSVWGKVRLCQDMHREAVERSDMEQEEILTRRFNMYFKLQLALSSMDALVFAIKRFYGKVSVFAPRMIEKVEVQKKESKLKPGGKFNKSKSRGAGSSAVSPSRASSRPMTPASPMTTTNGGDSSPVAKTRSSSRGFNVYVPPVEPPFQMSTLATGDFFPRSFMDVSSTVLRPTFTFSWASLRALQLRQPFRCRLPIDALYKATLHVPRFHNGLEGRVTDPDVNLYLRVHLRDPRSEKWRIARGIRVARGLEEEERIRAKRRKDIMTERKAARTYLFGKAAAIMEGVGHMYASEAEAQQRLARRLRLRTEKEENARQAKAVTQKAEDLEDSTFEQQYNTVTDPMCGAPVQPPLRRRHSIGDPGCMYGRIAILMQPALKRRAMAQRRLSEPCALQRMHPEPFPKPAYVAQIKRSLVLYHQRLKILNGFLDPKFEATWASVAKPMRLKRMQRALALAWLNPRLPREMMGMLLDGKRRRTVGEPERLSRQLFVMFETRNAFMRLRMRSRLSDNVHQRRRSFDLGEDKDNTDNITFSIGYQFEEPFVVPSLYDLRMDSITMKSRIVYSGFDEDEEIDPRTGKRQKRDKRKKGRGGKNDNQQGSPSRSAASMAMRNASRSEAGSKNRPREKTEEELEEEEMMRLRGLLENDPKRFKRGMHKKREGEDEEGKAKLAPPPEIWQEHFSPTDGKVYYYFEATNESSWELPDGVNVQILSQLQDASGAWYWHNNTTGEDIYDVV